MKYPRDWQESTNNKKTGWLRYQEIARVTEGTKFDFSCQKKILDIGAGKGFFLDHLRRNHFTAAQGIDRNPRNKESCPKVLITQGRISEMPFKDNSFDFVTSCSVFHSSVYDFQDNTTMLTEVHRILKRDGLYIGMEVIEGEQLKDIIEKLKSRSNSIIIGDGGIGNPYFIERKDAL